MIDQFDNSILLFYYLKKYQENEYFTTIIFYFFLSRNSLMNISFFIERYKIIKNDNNCLMRY